MKVNNMTSYQFRTILFFSLIITSSAFESMAQSINISAIIRPRFEVQYGYRFPPDTSSIPQILVSQRTRLNALYNDEHFSAFASLQDARIWGDEVIATDIASLGLHEAWGQYKFNKQIALRVGRQELVYDNKRLVTDGHWIQQGRAYDAAVLKIGFGTGWRIDAGGSYNQQTNNYFGTFYNLGNPKTLDFLWINKSNTDSLFKYSISAMGLGDGYQTPDSTGVFMRYTYGLNTSFNHNFWGINLEGYRQSGKTRTINQSGNIVPDSFQTVKAYMFSVNPWIQPIKNLQIGVGLDYLSGSDALDTTHSGTTNMFNSQYGAAHRFYGKMDLFFNLPASTRNGGLADAYLNLKYNYKGWEFSPEFHYFSLQNNVEDVENPGVPLDKHLGSEIDIIVVKDLTKQVNLNTGFCMFFPTRTIEFTKTSTFSQIGGPTITGAWFYVMLTFKPVFFSN